MGGRGTGEREEEREEGRDERKEKRRGREGRGSEKKRGRGDYDRQTMDQPILFTVGYWHALLASLLGLTHHWLLVCMLHGK